MDLFVIAQNIFAPVQVFASVNISVLSHTYFNGIIQFFFVPGINKMAAIDAEQFSLRWNNFHNNLTAGFHDLLLGEDLVDVTLAAEGKFVQAHKMVLSVCSPYFKDLFKVSVSQKIKVGFPFKKKELFTIIYFIVSRSIHVSIQL